MFTTVDDTTKVHLTNSPNVGIQVITWDTVKYSPHCTLCVYDEIIIMS